ncbi:MAG: nuclear transport factor 2 family protein [Deltaproteobacteria bacterium]|nr:nuclear transport factor 2 family protein [Deltaproteobacteria bacterium]
MKDKLLHIFFLAFFSVAASAQSQAEQSHSLRDTIQALDKQLFDAFNACDLDTFRQFLAEDVEFYQDNDDVTVTRAALEPSFKDRCRPDNAVKLRRELVLESVEVHPIQGYGAVQLGAHQFWVVNSGEPDQLGSTPRFVHLWRNTDGTWEITRVISYGH